MRRPRPKRARVCPVRDGLRPSWQQPKYVYAARYRAKCDERGVCIACAKALRDTATMCRPCADKHRDRERARRAAARQS